MITDDLVKVAEAARIMGFSMQHTRLLIRQGKLKGTKIGRDWIVARESLESFLAQRNTQPLLAINKRGRRPRAPLNGWFRL